MFLSWLPENVSSFGRDIDGIIGLIYWVTFAWFIVTMGTFAVFLVRYRRRPGRPAAYITGNRWREAAWVLLPCVLVLVLDLWIDFKGARVWAKVKVDMPQSDVHLRVTGKQFNWVVTYPGPDGKFDTADDKTFLDEIHVPAGQPVRLTLGSKDVIHSFFLPNLRLKQDVLPGRAIPAWIDAMKPGKYELPCAYLCGFGHSGMKATLFVHDRAEWDRWVAEQWPAGGAPEAKPAGQKS
jgi:cytochrome c oxidase subunit 2